MAIVTPSLLTRESFATTSVELARSLLGGLLVCDLRLSDNGSSDGASGRVSVRLTEVEAYAGADDPGSHGYRGRTPRTEVMFGPPGHLYVYFSYGMHWCANVVCGADGECAAVLLRAGEVVDGIERARRRRARPDGRVPRDVDLARGPARLTRALGLDGAHNGVDLGIGRGVWLEGAAAPIRQDVVRAGGRVGLSGAGGDPVAFPWRFWLDGEPTVSPYRPAAVRRRRSAGTTDRGQDTAQRGRST